MRKIIITRTKRNFGALLNLIIMVDEEPFYKIKNGEIVILHVNEEAHEIQTKSKNGISNKILISQGEENIELYLRMAYYSTGPILSYNDESMNEEEIKIENEILNDMEKRKLKQKQVTSYFCGIIVSLILLVLSYLLYTNDGASRLGFIVSAVLSIASGAVIIIGGFWIWIIPLPYIAVWRVGCVKPNQPRARKIVLEILSLIFPLMIILALLLL